MLSGPFVNHKRPATNRALLLEIQTILFTMTDPNLDLQDSSILAFLGRQRKSQLPEKDLLTLSLLGSSSQPLTQQLELGDYPWDDEDPDDPDEDLDWETS